MPVPTVALSYRVLISTALIMLSPLCCRADDAALPDPAADTSPMRALRLEENPPKVMPWEVYLTGYSYHDRKTYTEAQLHKMNEATWGGGIGRSYRNSSGNEESLYAIGIRDSNKHAQWMAGYAYQWKLPLKTASQLEAGAGLTALVIQRHDWFNGRPFPAVLPMASLGNRLGQLIAVYVPHLSDRKKRGNILSMMLKISL